MPGYSYTGGRNYYDELTNGQSDSTHLSQGDRKINESIQIFMSLAAWTFLEVVETVPTVSGQRAYQIPASIRETLDDVYIDIGVGQEDLYLPTEVNDSQSWKVILRSNTGEADGPDYFYRRSGKVEFDPIPASNGSTIYFVGRKRFGNLSVADYTTGTASVDSGGTIVTGAGGATFTEAMVGRYISFTSGDGLLYEIAGYTDATHITLTKPYEGAVNVSSSAFVLGQYAPIPVEYQVIPIYRAAALWWSGNDNKRAEYYWQMYDGGQEMGRRDTPGGLVGQCYERYGRKSEGGYMPPLDLLTPLDPNIPPRRIDANFS